MWLSCDLSYILQYINYNILQYIMICNYRYNTTIIYKKKKKRALNLGDRQLTETLNY